MPLDLLQAMFDPSTPIPSWWPAGGLGAFLLFLMPIGGIPLGVLWARDAGVSLAGIIVLYAVRDVVLAPIMEVPLRLFCVLARHIPRLDIVNPKLNRIAIEMGFRREGNRSPWHVVLVGFVISPGAGRLAAMAARQRFLPGWALAIAGDVLYFVLLMASTLWLREVLANDRIATGLMLLITWLVAPRLLKRVHLAAPPLPAGAPVGGLTPALAASSSGGSVAMPDSLARLLGRRR
jgi:hypothetical protein